MNYNFIHNLLHISHITKLSWLLEPVLGGMGVILTLHHVRPCASHEFAPNKILEITPDFLSDLISHLKMNGYDFISIDDAVQRILQPNSNSNRWVVVTLDDAYRDNLTYAVPIFNVFNVPFCIFVPTAFPSGKGKLWWIALEEVIRTHNDFSYKLNNRIITVDVRNLLQKNTVWQNIQEYLKKCSEYQIQEFFNEFSFQNNYNFEHLCTDLILNWQELIELNKSKLCTLGAHTHTHCSLKRSSLQDAIFEMEQSREIIYHNIGVRPNHIAYPYGSLLDADTSTYELAKELGFSSGLTTRAGVITKQHAKKIHQLPRISVNGLFQSLTEVNALISGFPVRMLGN